MGKSLARQIQNFRKMSSHLRLSERGCLLVVATPDADADHVIAEELRRWTRDDVKVLEFTFAPEPVEHLSLSYHLRTLPSPQNKSVLFVFGLDDLPADARTTCIHSLNWGRERLAWAAYSVVLWVRSQTIGDLMLHAPDFFSWRSGVFEFELPRDPEDRADALAHLRLFAPATLDELRQHYCEYIVRTCQWLDFRGLLQLRNVVRLPLDEVFVPLQATTGSEYPLRPEFISSPPTSERPDAVAWRMMERRRIERRVTLNEAIRQHRLLVVLGDPGSGKSTLLRYLALTFAQGEPRVKDQIGIDEDRLPILVPLSAFAEARKRRSTLPLAEFLPHYFSGQGLPDFSPVFEDVLHSGHALILLDGLDEMLTYDDRTSVARAVVEFANAYPGCRVIVTSRIAGYVSGMLPASFATFTLAPFDDDAIQRFARQWSLAFEAIGLPTPTLPPDAQRRAMLRAEQLATAVTSHPSVRRLATNPLLLTLLALIHHQGTRLPQRRVDLYRLCVEALAETWNLARSLTGRPIDLRLGERRLDEAFVVRILAPVACWMHETEPTGLVERDELAAHIAEQFVEREDASPDEAASLARDFVDLAREQMGLLVERAPDVFSFLHLSVQEYLAARFLSERMDAFERLKPRLHHPRWREVVLLTAGCLHGDFANTFVENILNAHSLYDELLHRDLLLAARCIGNDVPVSPKLREQIRDALFDLWRDPPFSRLRDRISRILAYLRGSVIGSDVLDFLLSVVQDRGEKEWVRGDAASALGAVAQGEERAVNVLLSIVQDKRESQWLRWKVAVASGQARQGEERVVNTLLSVLQDKDENERVRAGTASALGQVGQGEERIVKLFLSIVQDKAENKLVRGTTASALGQVGEEEETTVKLFLSIVQDKSENELVRTGAALGLRQAGQGEESVVETLLNVVQDKGESEWVREGAAYVLGQVGQGEERIVKLFLSIVQDKGESEWVREGAASALGQVGQGGESVVNTLLNVVQDKNENEGVRVNAAYVLGQVGQGEERIVNTLLQVAEEPDLQDAALGALWDVLEGTKGETM